MLASKALCIDISIQYDMYKADTFSIYVSGETTDNYQCDLS